MIGLRAGIGLFACGFFECMGSCSEETVEEGADAQSATIGASCFVGDHAFQTDGDGPSTPLVSVDADRDGALDVFSIDDGELAVRRRRGDGRLDAPRAAGGSIDGDAVDLLAVQIDDDGIADVLVVTETAIRPWFGDGGGGLTPGTAIDGGRGLTSGSVAAADLDDDGSIELAVAVNGEVELWRLDDAATVVARLPLFAGDTVGPLVSFDLSDRVGAELAVVVDGSLAFVDLDPGGTIVPLSSHWGVDTALAAGDLDGDGSDEVVAIGGGSAVTVYGTDGEAGIELVDELVSAGGFWSLDALTIADIDGDARLDILGFERAASDEDGCGHVMGRWRGHVELWLGNGGSAQFTHRIEVEERPAIVDLDGSIPAEIVIGEAITQPTAC